MGVGNGDPLYTGSEKANHIHLFSGFAQLLVQALEPGTFVIQAESDGLSLAECKIEAETRIDH